MRGNSDEHWLDLSSANRYKNYQNYSWRSFKIWPAAFDARLSKWQEMEEASKNQRANSVIRPGINYSGNPVTATPLGTAPLDDGEILQLAGGDAGVLGTNSAPKFIQPRYKFRISVNAKSNNEVIGDLILAIDSNAADKLVYSLVEEHPFFKIETDGRYGKLLLKDESDGISSSHQLQPGVYEIEIKVTDNNGNEDTATVVVTVEDKTDPFLGNPVAGHYRRGSGNIYIDAPSDKTLAKFRKWAAGGLEEKEISHQSIALITGNSEILTEYFLREGLRKKVSRGLAKIEMIQTWGWRIEFTSDPNRSGNWLRGLELGHDD